MDNNTINTAANAIEKVNEIGCKMPDKKLAMAFGAGVVTAIVVDKIVIPTGKKVVSKIKAKVGKNKPVNVEAEIVEIEE